MVKKFLLVQIKQNIMMNNNDTTFSGSVEMIYGDHKINSGYLDLSFKESNSNFI